MVILYIIYIVFFLIKKNKQKLKSQLLIFLTPLFFVYLMNIYFLLYLPLICKQIDTDDVITLEEQVYIISGAHAKCDISIKAQLSLLKGLCDLCAVVCKRYLV